MNVVVIGRKQFTGPASWDELTTRHVRQLLNWRVCLESDPAGRFVLLQLWYGIRYRHARLLDDDQRLELVSLLDFLEERPERWMLPQLRVNGRRYIGPGDSLEHLTFGEFMHAEAAKTRFQHTGFAGHLAELMAALYRPKALFFQQVGEHGRRLFDRRTLDEQMRTFLRVSPALQQGVLMNYLGCLDRFPEEFSHLFKPAAGSSEGNSTWLDVGISLARQTGALGTFAQLETTNLYLVLTTLDALMKESDDLKAQAEKWKS